MRNSFAIILVSLLLAFYAIFGITFLFLPPKDMGTPENSGEALKTALMNEAYLEHGLYLREGCQSHVAMERAHAYIKLAQPDGNSFTVLCGGAPSPAFTKVLHKAMATQALATGTDGAYWVIAYPFRTSGGDQLVIAQYSLQATRYGIPWVKMFIPFAVCGLVALSLAYFFSRPVRELRSVVRRFADGRLDARVPESKLRLPTSGANEIHSLMVDFNQMADRIAGLMEAQKLLLRDVSHELRSPLARLSVALELARDQAPATVEIHLQRIEDETNQLNLLIGQLLSLSSIESLRKPVTVKTVALVHLVEAHLPNLQFEARARGCSVSLSALAHPMVAVDPELIGRAIENIARNAIRYSPVGGVVEIEVSSVEEQKRSSAMVRIMDRGPGVPEEMRTAIFHPFVRVDASRNENTGGFGVGLAIAERAILLHGGQIQALPRTGGGLAIEIRLQAKAALDEPVARFAK
jgi:two-component system, OmpR family, sensor histidine kinase CpxA